MRGLVLLGAAVVATFALAGAAAAGNPGKPEPPGHAQTPPGQEQTPPGQAKRAETQPDKAIPPGQQNVPAQQDAPSVAETEGGHAAPPAAPAAQEERAQPATASPHHESHGKPEKETKPAVAAPTATAKPAQSNGNSAVAHVHVIICHRTGSLSHPYVVINISKSAWLEGHTTHPTLNGNDDILLKDGASPGEKMALSSCHVTPNTPETPKPTPTGDPKDPGKPTPPASKPDPGRPGPRPSAPPLFPNPPDLGADVAPAKSERSGVAAEVAVAGHSAELPFTGMPLWVAVLAGFWLIGSGLGIRKAFYDPGEVPAEERSKSY